jgi:hypothetical protein
MKEAYPELASMITKPPMPPWLRLIGRDNGKGGVAGGMQ